MDTTPCGRQTANNGHAVTLSHDERMQLLSGYTLSGLFAAATEIADRPGAPDREAIDSIRFGLRVADALGDPDKPGPCTLVDDGIIRFLHQAVAQELDGLLGDDEFDGLTGATRATAMSIERKLGVDRFEIAARHGVELDEIGTPEDRRESLAAQSEIAYYTRLEFEKAVVDRALTLDARSRKLVIAIADALTAAGTKRVEVPA